MYLKGIGSVLIVVATSLIGYGFGLDLQKHLEEQRYLRQIIFMIRGEIRYAKTPLSEVLEHVGKRSKDPYRSWFQTLAAQLRERSGNSFQTLWEQTMKTYLIQSALSQEDLEQLRELGQNLGYLDGEMQIRTIDLYLERLELAIEKTREDLTAKKRLYNYLGVMSGILIAVVLI